MSTILIAGDLLPTKRNSKLFIDGKTEEIFGQALVEMFKKADYCVANLEGPLCDNSRAVFKSGPCISAIPETIYGIKKMGFDCLSLANNHIMDYGENGLNSTIKILTENNIAYVGAGGGIATAKKALFVNVNGVRMAIYSCAEYEFSIATKSECGANPFDDLNITDDISELKREADYVIVIYHGMKELYRYPAPYVVKRCRKLVEKGADLVLCQHSHCIGCFEKYHEGTILYGQGDFCFCGSDIEERRNGLLVQVDLHDKKVEFIPVQRADNVIRLSIDERELILNEFFARSQQIQETGFIENSYAKLAAEMLPAYKLQSLSRIGSWIRRLGLNNFVSKVMKPNHMMNILNNLRCEAHNDLYVKGIEDAYRDLLR